MLIDVIRSIPLICILIGILGWYSIDTWSIAGWWSAKWHPTDMHWSKISWLLTDCWLRFSVLTSSVNRAFSNKYSMHYYKLLLWNVITLKIKIATDRYLFLFQISCCTLSLSRHCHKKAWNGHWSGYKNWGYSNSVFFVLDTGYIPYNLGKVCIWAKWLTRPELIPVSVPWSN